MIRAVVDTNVLLEGLTRHGAAAEVVDAWVAGYFQPCVSTALAFEYQDVLARKLSPLRSRRALLILQALLARCVFVPIYFSYRPASRDPGDDFVIDCVLNSQAILVTANVRDFVRASRELGFHLVRPSEFLKLVSEDRRR